MAQATAFDAAIRAAEGYDRPIPSAGTAVFSTRLPQPTAEVLAEIMREEGMTQAQVLRLAVREFLKARRSTIELEAAE
jgi:hypothetical protein